MTRFRFIGDGPCNGRIYVVLPSKGDVIATTLDFSYCWRGTPEDFNANFQAIK